MCFKFFFDLWFVFLCWFLNSFDNVGDDIRNMFLKLFFGYFFVVF